MEIRVEVKKSSMSSNELEAEIIEIAKDAYSKSKIEKDVATKIKKTLDEKAKESGQHDGTWHCIVGKNYACSVSHDTKNLLFFALNQHNVLVFMTA